MIIIASDSNLEEELGKVGKSGVLTGGTFVDLTRKELRQQAKLNGAQCGAKFASNEALKSVSYPIQALAKSSKTLPAMLGCLWSGKAITRLQWAAAFGITLGTAGFSMGGKKGSDIEAKPLGVLLLIVSLLCDGTVSAAQQGMRNQKEKLSPYEQMFMTNVGAAMILLPVAFVSGQLQAGIGFLMENITILDEIAIFALCSAFGQVFIFLTIAWFGPDTNAKITTVRKMATVLISIVWFGHTIGTTQWAFVGVVFASVFAEISEKLSRASNWKTDEPASTDELLQLSQSGPSPWHSMMPRLTNGKKENGKKSRVSQIGEEQRRPVLPVLPVHMSSNFLATSACAPSLPARPVGTPQKRHLAARGHAAQRAPVVVLGGGAAGMMAAMTAGRRGRPVTLLEKNSELGKKIRISGGGRCNFTNISEKLDRAYHSSPVIDEDFAQSDGSFFQKAFRRYPPEKFIALVESHGIKYHEKKLGQLFCNKSARQIVDMLQQECLAASVELCTEAECLTVAAVDGPRAARYRIEYLKDDKKKEIYAEAVLVASGGLSYARSCGATDLAHRIADSFNLKVTGVRPGLVPLLLPSDAWTRSLTGVSLEVAACMGSTVFVERILFTHKGISGPAVLQASSYWEHHADAHKPLVLDVLPYLKEEEVLEWLQRRAESCRKRQSRRPMPASEELARKLPRRFADGFWKNEASKHLGVRPRSGLEDLESSALQRLASLLKRWEVKVIGTEGYPKAEVTCGGVSTEELSDETMECKRQPGLFFIGEAVDVTGWLGGYNFQWAWASGFAAGAVC
ncbi:unnamed protein product [Cladocopium goreaui]|nr:unnamed protein product [Cladocopium goreaui]